MTGIRRHLRVGRRTRCGLQLERWDDATWIRRDGTGAIVMVSESLNDVDCERCLKLEAVAQRDA
jgi:hypothetical protein